MLDQRFHLRVHLVLRRRHDARIVAGPGATRGDAFDRLPADFYALTQLPHTYAIPSVHIPFGPGGHFEVIGLVPGVREVLADVVVRPRCARDWSEQSPGERILLRNDPDALRAPHENVVLAEKPLVLIQLLGKPIEKGVDRFMKPARQILAKPSDPDVAWKETESGDELVDVHQEL